VTPQNTRELRRGHVSGDVRADGDKIAAALVIDDAELIEKIAAGKVREISCGYRCDTEETPGVHEGEAYDRIQRNIRYNHVAVLRRGRAGSDVRIRLDGNDDAEIHADGYGEVSPGASITIKTADGKTRRTTWREYVDRLRLGEAIVDKLSHSLDQSGKATHRGEILTMDGDRSDAASAREITTILASLEHALEGTSDPDRDQSVVSRHLRSGDFASAMQYLSSLAATFRSRKDATSQAYANAIAKIRGRVEDLRDKTRGDSAVPPGDAGTGREKRKTMETIRIDGVDYPLSTPAEIEAAVKAHARFVAKVEADAKTLETTTARADTAEAKVKTLESELTAAKDPTRLDALVTARVELVGKAAKALGSEFKADGLPELEIMRKVIAKVRPSMKLDGKGDEYIRASFAIVSEELETSTGDRSDGAADLRRAAQPIPGKDKDRTDGKDKPTDPRAKMRTENAERAARPLAVSKD
jgi:hypothetical protein